MKSNRSDTFFVATQAAGAEVYFPKKSYKGTRRVKCIRVFNAEQLLGDPDTLLPIDSKSDAAKVTVTLRAGKGLDLLVDMPIASLNPAGTKYEKRFAALDIDTDFCSIRNNTGLYSQSFRYAFQFEYE